MVLAGHFHTCPHTTRTHVLFLPGAETRGFLNLSHNTSKAQWPLRFGYETLEAQRLGR